MFNNNYMFFKFVVPWLATGSDKDTGQNLAWLYLLHIAKWRHVVFWKLCIFWPGVILKGNQVSFFYDGLLEIELFEQLENNCRLNELKLKEISKIKMQLFIRGNLIFFWNQLPTSAHSSV